MTYLIILLICMLIFTIICLIIVIPFLLKVSKNLQNSISIYSKIPL